MVTNSFQDQRSEPGAERFSARSPRESEVRRPQLAVPGSLRCSAPRAGGDRGAAAPAGAAGAPPGLALLSSCPGQCGRPGRSVRAAPAPPSHRTLPAAPRIPVPGPRSGMAPGLLDLVHLTTWAVCAVIKLPQLVAVLRAGSAWGLSVSSLLLELAG